MIVEKNEKTIEKLLFDSNDDDFTIEDLQKISKDVSQIQARIINYSPFTKIKQLKANFYGKLNFELLIKSIL